MDGVVKAEAKNLIVAWLAGRRRADHERQRGVRHDGVIAATHEMQANRAVVRAMRATRRFAITRFRIETPRRFRRMFSPAISSAVGRHSRRNHTRPRPLRATAVAHRIRRIRNRYRSAGAHAPNLPRGQRPTRTRRKSRGFLADGACKRVVLGADRTAGMISNPVDEVQRHYAGSWPIVRILHEIWIQ